MDATEHGGRGPSAGVRRLVTTLLIVHFLAVLTAVLASPEPGFPPPQLAVWAQLPVRPYLGATFMLNGYRFFSPNPGAPTMLWFRIQYQDKSVRWVTAPRPRDGWFRAAYDRRLNLANQPTQHVTTETDEPTRYRLTDLGRIIVSSYARHVATRHRSDHADVAVRSVGIYFAQHAARSPEQIRAGWSIADCRTYRATFAGAYRADGERIDEFRPILKEQPMSFVAAGILEVDVYPRLVREPNVTASEIAARLSLPAPIRDLIERFPELQQPARRGDELKQYIARLLEECEV